MRKRTCATCACRDHTGYCELQMTEMFDNEYCYLYLEKEEPTVATWIAIVLMSIVFIGCMLSLGGCASKPAPKPTEQVVLQVSDKPAPDYLMAASTPGDEEDSTEAEDAEAPIPVSMMPFTADYVEHGDGNCLNKYDGVNYYNGKTETYYSSNALRHKDIGEWTAGSDGVWRDSEGYIILASSDMPFGTVHETSLGEGKVYDTGCAEGIVDVYVNW